MEPTTDNGHADNAIELLVIPDITKNHGKDDLLSDNDHVEEEEHHGLPPQTPSPELCCLYRGIYRFRHCMRRNSRVLKRACLGLLFLAYLGYFSYCMYYRFGDEPSIRLLVCTIIGVLCILKSVVKCPRPVSEFLTRCYENCTEKGRKPRKVIQWCLYLLSVGGAVTIVAVDVVVKRPQNLFCLAGLAILILICVLLSRQPEKINWHAVFWAMSLQFWFAVLIGKTSFGRAAFQWLAERTVEFLKFADKGSIVVFGEAYLEHRFIFQLMPTVIFFNAMICVLYYLGVVQVIFAEFGRFLSFCIGTSPIESVSAAANLFLSLLETPLLIKPFVRDITRSELFTVMTAGYASIAGSLLWAFAAFGAPINHILTASVMSAPAALAYAKLLYPDERAPTIKAEDAYKVDVGQHNSLLNALSTGAKDGLKMAGLVVVNLMIYASFLEFLDQTVLWFGERAGVEDFTLSTLIAYMFSPATFLMGIEAADCFKAARLLGLKILTLTTVSFIELGNIITNGKTLQTYLDTYNSTWTHVGEDILLDATNTTLRGGVVSERTGVLATYMICGLSNLGSIGVTVGAYVAVAPSRHSDIFKQASWACLAGNLACFSTACVAGLLYTD